MKSRPSGSSRDPQSSRMTDQEVYQYIDFTPLKGGEPVFWGTKIRVVHILEDFCKGMKHEDILKEHPQLNDRHLQACFVYCRLVLKENDALRGTAMIGFLT